jgi:transposase
MSNDTNALYLEQRQPGRRRHYTAEQKRALLDEAARPGSSMSIVARQYGVAPSLLFNWKRVMDDATKKGLTANERVVPESEVKQLRVRIRELERMLGKKTMEVEILQEAVSIAREKKWISGGGSSNNDGGQ